MCCCMFCYVSGTCVEKPVNYYIKIQDLDNYIIQLYILKYVGSMKSFSCPTKIKKWSKDLDFLLFVALCWLL